MHPTLKSYFPVAQAIGALLHPYAEIVLHDLDSETIAAIFSNFSKRKVGDPSNLTDDESKGDLPEVFPPYPKVNWDGRPLRSTTAVIRDEAGQPIGLFCINLDISVVEQARTVIEHLTTQYKQPELLFKEDWEEKIYAFVQSYLAERHLTLASLTREKRRHLIEALAREGALKIKGAANYVCRALGISRATFYKEWRKLNETTTL